MFISFFLVQSLNLRDNKNKSLILEIYHWIKSVSISNNIKKSFSYKLKIVDGAWYDYMVHTLIKLIKQFMIIKWFIDKTKTFIITLFTINYEKNREGFNS